MSKYFLGLVLGFFVTVAQSQQINIPSLCISAEELQKAMLEWNELPVARGLSSRNVDNDVIASQLTIFINAKTGSWTIIEELAQNRFCIVAIGDKFEPMPTEIIKQENSRQERF